MNRETTVKLSLLTFVVAVVFALTDDCGGKLKGTPICPALIFATFSLIVFQFIDDVRRQ